ncbi:MAG: CoA-binding protein, partial [Thermoleophilaceae bacterium]
MDLERLLRPASIAVVGASERPGSYGGQTLLNLDTIAFPGEVWGVNPGRTSVYGRRCVPSLEDLPSPVDAVVVAIPAAAVAEAVEQAGAIGCGGAVVFSAGFAEVASGVPLQADLVAAAAQHELPVCGPNGNGIVAMHSRAALWGDALRPREPGHVALVSQSDNVAVNALATQRGLRFHTVVSCGNQAVLSAPDYLEQLAHDEN